jgi:hypothetical protein
VSVSAATKGVSFAKPVSVLADHAGSARNLSAAPVGVGNIIGDTRLILETVGIMIQKDTPTTTKFSASEASNHTL